MWIMQGKRDQRGVNVAQRPNLTGGRQTRQLGKWWGCSVEWHCGPAGGRGLRKPRETITAEREPSTEAWISVNQHVVGN